MTTPCVLIGGFAKTSKKRVLLAPYGSISKVEIPRRTLTLVG